MVGKPLCQDRAGLASRALPLLAVLVVVLTAVLAASTLVRVVAGSASTLDFSAFYTAGHIVSEGLGDRLYDLELQEAAQRDLSGGNYDRPLPFAAPAFVAFVFAPLTRLPLGSAYGVMLVINLATLGALLALMRGVMTDVPPRPRSVALAVSALAIPTIAVLTAGQIDLIIAAAMLGGLILRRAGRPAAAGAVLALAFAKPQLAVGVLALLVATRDWRPLATMLGSGTALALAPVAALGAHAITGNIDALDAVGRPALMANWRGLLASLGAPDHVRFWGPGWAVIAAGATLLAWRAWRRPEATFEQSWALALLLPLLVSPHLHGQSLALAMPALALVLRWQATALRAGGSVRGQDWEARAEALLLGFFVLLFARWVAALAGVSLGVILVAVLFVAVAAPDRVRLLPQAVFTPAERRAA